MHRTGGEPPQNKANFLHQDRQEAPAAGGVGCTNKPNFRVPVAMAQILMGARAHATHRQDARATDALRCHYEQDFCAKQTQFSARPPGRPCPREGESCETKPIWLRPHLATGSNGAKQSQFRPEDRGATHASPIGREGPGAGRWGQTCETKPISGRRAGTGRSMASNKANCAGVTQRASTWWRRNYGELNIHEGSVRQSQFPRRRQGAEAGQRCGRGRRGRVVQTKPIFAPGGRTGSGIRQPMPAAPWEQGVRLHFAGNPPPFVMLSVSEASGQRRELALLLLRGPDPSLTLRMTRTMVRPHTT